MHGVRKLILETILHSWSKYSIYMEYVVLWDVMHDGPLTLNAYFNPKDVGIYPWIIFLRTIATMEILIIMPIGNL
jgi:hypothetical protein